MTTITTIKQLTPELRLQQYNEIPVIALEHRVGKALIALQGAHLFSWQPKGTSKEVLWLSEIEPFTLGNAIRGGVPICYPWFGGAKSPAHGYARISLWQLSDYKIEENKVRLEFCLFSSDHLIEAKTTMIFSQDCEIIFQHYAQQPAQLALHNYFNLSDVANVEVQNLPTECFNTLTQQQENVPSPRLINQHIDCIYKVQSPVSHQIIDKGDARTINVAHHNASNVVLWNPWHKSTSGISEIGYKTMVCLETARIAQPLQQGECCSVKISLNP
ncbi:D-hexose-6-phosphate mutarotase [Avibacterium sp. 20-126]|uniref:D-hexose-6-phosphate mutarotase n=1 Tax=Avibacterium sp. 20-126 TaxID=2911524 RepID=UPI00218593B4|nr:D-hexose-6-phosphate mutarotase [Avibacterium sp. 20-126]